MDRREFLKNTGLLAGAASVDGSLGSGAVLAQSAGSDGAKELGPMTVHLIDDWLIAGDPSNEGRAKGWQEGAVEGAVPVFVPGIPQMALPGYRGIVWYWNNFTVPRPPTEGERILLRSAPMGSTAQVWVNGKNLGSYEAKRRPFECDITGAVRTDGENRLAVRVLQPSTYETPDGKIVQEVPFHSDHSGIMGTVEVEIAPAVRVAELFVRPDAATGEIAVTMTVRNYTGGTAEVEAELCVGPATGGAVEGRTVARVAAPAGDSTHEVALGVSQPRLWDIDDPFLYRVTASVNNHERSVRCGFRDLRVVDGFFHLNGRRIFLKCTHTGSPMPVGMQAPFFRDHVRRDAINAKASGFNCVRYLSGPAWPEQLDFCDEIGMMVYEESDASWFREDPLKLGDRFDQSVSDMILRDRNHPSVTIWGMLNETFDGPVFEQAVAFLPKLRELDPTRLVVLSSGRWDQRTRIGSVSNPGGNEWEYVWGAEGPDAPTVERVGGPTVSGYVDRAGDAHFYPSVPQSERNTQMMRAMGAGDKPVFFSEYGIGSLGDVIADWLHYQEHGAREDLEDIGVARAQAQAFTADWERLGFGDVYASPRDMLRESQRLHARQRTICFDTVRSNPQFAGYNLTGMADWAMCPEGVWTLWREFKPATFDAMTDGWAPLRWCMFANPMHVYAGDEMTVEAVLANEDVLKPGQYPATFRIIGPGGVAWEKKSVVEVDGKFATAALKETIRIEGPAGQYTFAATLDGGGVPRGGRLVFHVSRRDELPQLDADVLVWGIDEPARTWLATQGVRCTALDMSKPGAAGGLVLVGLPAAPERNAAAFEALAALARGGSTVAFLDCAALAHEKDGTFYLPLEKRGKRTRFYDWLYHKEIVARRHPVFAGLQAPGVLDWEYWGKVVTEDVFEDLDTPDDTMAAWFVTGYLERKDPWGYGCGLMLASYRLGEGRLVINTLKLLENLGKEPAADRLILNLVRYGSERQQATASGS